MTTDPDTNTSGNYFIFHMTVAIPLRGYKKRKQEKEQMNTMNARVFEHDLSFSSHFGIFYKEEFNKPSHRGISWKKLLLF
jgi:hypothetical protein